MNLIVAVDKNWAIGMDNKLLVSIPQDMKFFRETTKGKVVAMGRKTLESFIEAGLWDEIRRELSPMTVGDGTPAPHLPADIAIVSHHHYADNTITVYRRKQHKGSQA